MSWKVYWRKGIIRYPKSLTIRQYKPVPFANCKCEDCVDTRKRLRDTHRPKIQKYWSKND